MAARSPGEIVRLAKALSHPTRVEILIAMSAPPRKLSPRAFSRQSGRPLTLCAYHFRKLAELGFIAAAEPAPRGTGADCQYLPAGPAILEVLLAWEGLRARAEELVGAPKSSAPRCG